MVSNCRYCDIDWSQPTGICEICPPGTYRPEGSGSCVMTTMGFYQDVAGQTEPKRCPCGSPWSPNGATSEAQCGDLPTSCAGVPDGLTQIDPDGEAGTAWFPINILCKQNKPYLPLSEHPDIMNYAEGGKVPPQDGDCKCIKKGIRLLLSMLS